MWDDWQPLDSRRSFTATATTRARIHNNSCLGSCIILLRNTSETQYGINVRIALTSKCLPKCFDNFSITTLYGRCCVSFLKKLLGIVDWIREDVVHAYLLDCTFNAWRASTAESRTFDEWAPSLRESLIEYSLSDFSRPPLRSYNSNLYRVSIRCSYY